MEPVALKTETTEQRIIVEARVRSYIEAFSAQSGFGVFKLSSESLDALNDEVRALIADAVVRCQKNGRVTLKAQDF